MNLLLNLIIGQQYLVDRVLVIVRPVVNCCHVNLLSIMIFFAHTNIFQISHWHFNR